MARSATTRWPRHGREGLPASHPLILSAYVEPGEATHPGESGHRATVTFDLLGVPGPTTVRLFYDVGGHWGGVSNRTTLELAAWSLIMAGLAVATVALVTGAVTVVIGRRRHAPTGGPEAPVRTAPHSLPSATTVSRGRQEVRGSGYPGPLFIRTAQDLRRP